jgi:uncharacterized protein YyaL (SSP411 family)
MEDEVFSRDDVGEFMNSHYVCIKVDREERPDVDAAYMQAAQLMTGAGGWPLNLWLTPDLRPVYAGTYFPKQDFLSISAQIAKAWQSDRAQFESVADEIVKAVEATRENSRGGKITHELIDDAARSIVMHTDPQWGGLASRVKFPEPVVWEFLLHQYSRTRDAELRKVLTLTLDRMHDGGLYDHIGGGWHRYSTDREWLVPHFEKMLYDNAQLASLYIDAARVLEEPRYAAIARDTLDFMLREMQLPDGGFAASFDASTSEGEGAYYVWTPEQLDRVVWNAQDDLASVLGVSATPNFREHHGIVSGTVVTRRVKDPKELFEKYRVALQTARRQRTAPARDNKVVTAWNALAMLAELRRESVDYRPRIPYLLRAHRLADSSLCRASNNGIPTGPGVLEDYALLALALLGLHAQLPYELFLQQALTLIEHVEANFRNHDGGYFETPQTTELPFGRRMNISDTVEPSGNSVMARALLKASVLTGNLAYRERAGELLEHFAGSIAANPMESAHWLTVAELYLGPYYLVVVAAHEHQGQDKLVHDLRASAPTLNYEVVRLDGDALDRTRSDLRPLQPVLEGKYALDTPRPTVYVCSQDACHAPVHTAAEARELLLGL